MLHIIEQGYAPESRKTPHAHDVPSMSLVVAGALRERMGRVEEIARPLSISLLPAGIEHADEFSPDGARLLQIHFDAGSALDFVSDDGALDHWRWIHGGPGVRLFLGILAAVRSEVAMSIVETLIADVIAAAAGTPPTARSAGRPPRWLEYVRTAIDDYSRWPTVAELAVVGGVHRVHLAKQFRRFYGCAVSDYIRRRNVQRAAQHMVRSDVSLSEVAHDAGFSDQPHLCRAFRTETGVTPSAFRGLARIEKRRNSGAALR